MSWPHADVGHHSTILPVGCPVAEEGIAMVSRAPGGRSDLPDTQRLSLGQKPFPQIQVPWTDALGSYAASQHHLTANFIAGTADSDTTMHYDFFWMRFRSREETLYASG